jgi:FixJ family two-component response regulator
MNTEAGTVFIVDDVQDVRTAISRLLTTADYRVRLFESAEHYLDEQDGEEPGCLLLDICLPGLSGIELQRLLFGSPYARPIVFLTGMGDIQASVNAMKSGAVDFLTKPIDKQRLFAAIEEALRRDAAQRLDRAVRQRIEQRYSQLTRREREVMTRVVRGRLNKQIAGEFGIVEKTIKVHRARVMHKMGVRSIPDLVRLAERVGVAMELIPCAESQAPAWRPVSVSNTAQISADGKHVLADNAGPSATRISIPAPGQNKNPIAAPYM